MDIEDVDFSLAEFESDFCLALGMMEGLSYQEAVQQAKSWVKEAREGQSHPLISVWLRNPVFKT